MAMQPRRGERVEAGRPFWKAVAPCASVCDPLHDGREAVEIYDARVSSSGSPGSSIQLQQRGRERERARAAERSDDNRLTKLQTKSAKRLSSDSQ